MAQPSLGGTAAEPVKCCDTCGAMYRKDFPRCPNDGGRVSVMEVDPLLGSAALEPYVIDDLIGEGAMGRVYRAHHSRLPGKRYALKVLRGDLAAEQTMRLRFAKEAETASTLAHPNVVSVLDFGSSKKGLLFLAMELVEGTSVQELVDGDGPMPAGRVIRLAKDIARGLAYAHDRGLVHRDLKPANVLVVGSGDAEVARIVDFGIAISTDPDDARLTATGFTMGSPAYIAPEQTIEGMEVDSRADLYSLGVTMFEMLTGVLPFFGDGMAQMTQKAGQNAPTMSDVAPRVRVPGGLEAVVQRLLARWPQKRYESGHALIEALEALGTDGTLATDQLRGRAPSRRRAAIIAAVVVTGVALGAAGAMAWRATHKRSTAVAEPAPAPAPAAAAVAVAVAVADPVAVPDPVAVAAADPDAVTAAAPLVVDPPEADDESRSRRSRKKDRRDRKDRDDRKHERRVEAVKPVEAAPVPVAVPPPAPVPLPLPPPVVTPPLPVQLTAELAGVDVQGPLSTAVVRRAVTRTMSSITRCAATAPASTVEATFSIGEARRAAGVRASGSSPAAQRCVEAALAKVRTDVAPDVGDVAVTVRISFVAKGGS